jgi:DNA (cytosine-5)-methyltransferase 1
LFDESSPVVIDRAAFNQGVNAKYQTIIEESEVMPPLVAMGPHAVGTVPQVIASGQAKSEFASDLCTTQSARQYKDPPILAESMVARRLLPVECARLQGFPDDHAKIPWKNKSVDECPDGHQYQCYGNAMAVPVIAWIGARIQAVMFGEPFVYGIPETYRVEIESR